MRWPALRFERFFERHLRRKAAEQLSRERLAYLAAINSNRTWDDPKNGEIKAERIRNIELSYKEGIEVLYRRSLDEVERAPDPMRDDDLFRPLRNRAVDMASEISRPIPDGEGLGRKILG